MVINPDNTPMGSLFGAPQEDDAPYFEQIGRFIAAYAIVEGMIHQLARKLSGLKDNKARIIFSGSRIGDVVTRTRGLLESHRLSPKTKADILECFTQFDTIGIERDKLVHRYVEHAPGKLTVSNVLTAKDIWKIETDVFTRMDLQRLTLDCHVIYVRLGHVVHPGQKKVVGKAFLNRLHEPWTYKRTRPKTEKKPRKPSRRARRGQPQSSQA